MRNPYVFAFTGLEDKTEEEKADLDAKQVKTWKTVNEIRKEHGEEPLENGDIILDSSYLNYIQQQAMAAGGMGEDMGGEMSEEESENEDYSDYMSDEDSEDNSSDDYSEYLTEDEEEDTQKSLSKLILTLED